MTVVGKEKKTLKLNIDKAIDIIFFVVLLMVVSSVTYVHFYNQVYGSQAAHHSDMKAYILEMQGLDSGYSFPYPIFFKLAAFIHLFTAPETAVAIATVLLNSFSMIILKLAFNYFALKDLKEAWREKRWLAGILLSVLAGGMLFVSMLYLPNEIYLPGIRFKYMGVFSPNPFHNATYMAARPFSILAFLWYVKLLPQYEEKEVKLQDYLLFALFLLLATMTKPSFTLILVGTAGIIMLYRMIRSKFRNFVPTVKLGLCFIPTFIDLLYQYKGVFVPEEGAERGVGFCFGEVWGLYCGNIPFAVGLAMGFPLLVLILNWKQLKDNVMYRFSWQMYLMSFAMAFLLYEKGFRKPDFNFSWGYMYGIFFAFFAALLVLLKVTAEKKNRILTAVQWLGFAAHLGCGIYYFLGIFKGQMYY